MSFTPTDMEINAADGITTFWRELLPAHYILKVDSLSLFLDNNIDHYETSMFESGGYEWKLSLYPNGNKKKNVTDHISLYLAIANADALPSGWVVNVTFKLFLYNHIRGKYLTFQEAENFTCLYMMKNEVGFNKLVALETLKDPSNGFLLDDSCIFGAEIFVLKFGGKGESVSILKNPPHNTFTWKVPNFSDITEKPQCVCDTCRKIQLYPKGNGDGKGESISVFVHLVDDLPSHRKVFAKYILRVKGNHISDDKQKQGMEWFGNSSSGWGYTKFMPLDDFNKKSNSYLANGTLTINVEITLVSKYKDF